MVTGNGIVKTKALRTFPRKAYRNRSAYLGNSSDSMRLA